MLKSTSMPKTNLKKLDVYVYIDASNIKNALKVSGINLSFLRLLQYFESTYKNLESVKYFEGIDKKDTGRHKFFRDLQKLGYDLKTLERKAYTNPSKYKTFKCKNCKEKNTVEILHKSKTLKSNIDVYLCSELMGDLLAKKKPSHAILLTCDGDYAEMIRNILEKNKNIHISVFSTPFTKTNNYLSVRLKELERIDRYYLEGSYTEVEPPNGKLLHRSGIVE